MVTANYIMPSKNRGFTLIELLVVISIIGLLASVTLVALQSVKTKAKETKNFVEIKEFVKALELYILDNNSYPGLFNIYYASSHVLHGKIDPLNHIGPEDIYIDALLKRTRVEGNNIEEIILATNPDMEGEATAMFIRNKLNEIANQNGFSFKVTRLGYGLPMGGNLEYADYMTLRKAIENRSEFKQ
jgi:prepilin-type N-terminal cleavage/methylation domain-containing protein